MRAYKSPSLDNEPPTTIPPRSTDSARAFEASLPRYRSALLAYLVRSCRLDVDFAEDVVQPFMLKMIKIWQQKYDPSRGRFRHYVLKVLRNHAIDIIRNPPKPSVDLLEALAAEGPEVTTSFDVHWARSLVHHAIETMKSDCERRCRPEIWGVFEDRVLRPVFDGTPPRDYEQLVDRYGLPSVTQAANLLVTAKRTFRRHLYAVLRPYAKSEQEVEREVRDLQEILAGRCAEPDPVTRIE